MISVCMAVYNGSVHLKEQLDSVVSQLGLNDEIVIVDDRSSDNTLRIIQDFADSRIKIIKNSENLGVVKSFELAISHSVGDYIFLCDQDDIWMSDKVETVMESFRETHSDLIISDAYIMNDNLLEINTFFQYRNSSIGIFRNIIKNSFIGCCMAFTSPMKAYILPFPENISMHDSWIGIVISIYGKSLQISDRLIIYRRHSGNVTSMYRSSIIKMASKRFKDISSLIIRIREIN